MADLTGTHYRGYSPYLYYEDAGAALDWLVRTFGFTEKVRYLDGAGVVREAELHAGDTLIMLHGADPGYWAKQSAPGPVGHMCIVYVEDVDAHHKATVAAGVDAPEPEDQPYGARIYIVTDPGGHQWTFWQHLTDEVRLAPGWREVRPA
ncbi:VOC family protein [Micromonospora aurantiaca]|uniref:VOC family protein n=1 Tax=Micromonospora aurantiaca (nom. illeg.) TaxID=47850 RepID=UPI003794058E